MVNHPNRSWVVEQWDEREAALRAALAPAASRAMTRGEAEALVIAAASFTALRARASDAFIDYRLSAILADIFGGK